MQILTLSLTNFKGHADAFFEFSRGTNAICGENGVGKTSIFEAIAWVIFDHCDYHKKELIRAGTSCAEATVEFLSDRDHRQYRIKRSTQRGFELFDPQLNAKLDIKKQEDVQRWLCDHLGVSPTTELSRLFAETIGIPQGTFTADFLKRPSDRKKIFDPILKVEDYKQTFERTRDLEAFALAQVQQIEQKLALSEVRLADWEHLKQQSQELQGAIATDLQVIESLNQQIESLQGELEHLQLKAQDIERVTQQQQQLTQERDRHCLEVSTLETNLSQAKAAEQICAAHQKDFEGYQLAQSRLKSIEVQRQQLLALQRQKEGMQTTLNQQQVQQSKLTTQLEAFQTMAAEIAQLSALVPQQEELEHQQMVQRTLVQELLVLQGQRPALIQNCHQLETQIQQLTQEIQSLQALEPQTEAIPALEQHRHQLTHALSQWQASQTFLAQLQPIFQAGKIERDRHRVSVQAALQQIEALGQLDGVGQQDLAGELEAIAEALKQGAILNTNILKSIHQLLTELAESSSPERLQQKLQQVNEQLRASQEIQARLSLLPGQTEQLSGLQTRFMEAQTQLQLQAEKTQALPAQQQILGDLEQALAQLNNPKQQIALLKKRLTTQAALETQQAQLSLDIAASTQALTDLDQQISAFQSLEQHYAEVQKDIQQYQAGYQRYLQHQRAAQSVSPLEAQLKALEAESLRLQAQWAAIARQLETLTQGFDAEQFKALQGQVLQQQAELNQRKGSVQPKQNQLATLQQQCQERQVLFEEQQGDRVQLQRKQQVYGFVQTARQIYQQSGPRISQLYQREISWEADRLFRELLDRPDIALKWTDDYDIQVQDQGHWRSFKSLSGGEQMCAALAVRLALLKILADINIAFFDEPTTNMDQIRRSQLAEAIGNLKSFKQLFVISHDDTFENITEAIIRLNKPSG